MSNPERKSNLDDVVLVMLQICLSYGLTGVEDMIPFDAGFDAFLLGAEMYARRHQAREAQDAQSVN